MIDGVFEHQDTTGGGGVITDGATQWMTAGAGIQHIERPPESLVVSGGLFHGTQVFGPGNALAIRAADTQPQAVTTGWEVLV